MRKFIVLLVLAGCAAQGEPRRNFPDVGTLSARSGLPDPLVSLDGKKISTAEAWRTERRPELKALFQHYMYGYLLAESGFKAEVRRTDPKAFGGKATLKEVAVALSSKADAPTLDMLLVVPNKRSGPAPVFVGHNFSGNHTLVADPAVPVAKGWVRARGPKKENKHSEEDRGKNVDTWCLEQSIDRGYAVATFYYGDVMPDKADFMEGVYPVYRAAKPGQKSPGETEPGAIALWAWGIHRAVDYLVTDKDIDAKRIAAIGHSRLGKTALLAAAMDERIALAIPHQAGCGGTAPSRTKNPKAETVKVINRAFPHWFNDTFKKFDEQVEKLPFDQNCLIAMVAPRPVLYSNALEDQWADPSGQFEMLQSASSVYKLLGVEGLGASEMPPIGKLVDSRVGYFIRAGRHSMSPEDWQVFWAFADKNLKG